MAITPGVASGGFQTIDNAAYETAFDASLHGGPIPSITIFASGSAINVKITPNHSQGVNATLKNDVIPAGESQTYYRFGPGGIGLIKTVELQAALAGGQARWTT